MDTTLKIGSWNVRGLLDKIDDPNFRQQIAKLDICFLMETWCCSNISIDGKYVYTKRARKEKKHGHASGGIILIIDSKLRSGIKIVKETGYGVWIKLCKHSLNLKQNLYMWIIHSPRKQ